MLPEVQTGACRGAEDGPRARVADVIESVPFWTAVALLTLVDVALFAWQFYTEDAFTREALQATELAISTLFVGELVLRCYASDRERLLCASNIFDTAVIILAFALSLVEVSTPILAARGARLLRLGATTTRCSRAARNTQRSAVEMRNFFTDARKSGLGMAARVAARATESDIAPLFVDCSKVPELAALLGTRPWIHDPRSAQRRLAASHAGVSMATCPVLAASATLKRAARAEIEKADATDVAFRAAAAKKAAKATAQHPGGGVVAADAATTTTTPLVDADGAPEDGEPASTDAEAPRAPRVVTSSKALVAIFDHALAAAKAKEAPPPRLLATIRNNGLGLLFLKSEI